MVTFENLNLIDPILGALRSQGFKAPTPIQAQAIPPMLEGRDVLGIAQTGTGKTAAFALPILQHLAKQQGKPAPRTTRVLILSPTRELAGQINDSITAFASRMRLSQACVFGGVGKGPQARIVSRGVDILVATPGRLRDLMEDNAISLKDVQILVLDEADRMLDMGFAPEVR
ncbi:MAG TPA: DEAD/DEAH box helicase, partial [Rhodospirillaceae bacterium]|nr:DEAD/DEAH box helicase [Rhodospirillaceae bacterium]